MAEVFKLSGAGNDFIAQVGAGASLTSAEMVAVCARALSLGADGYLRLERLADGARLHHWNSDGSRSNFCLNGSRSAAQLAFFLGWADAGAILRLETDAGILACRTKGRDAAEVELPPGFVGRPEAQTLEVEGVAYRGWRVEAGVPHFVLPWPSLADLPISTLGPLLRHHPDLGPSGANVDFVRVRDRQFFEIRTFERGVEGETLACGSGVIASVAALLAAEQIEPRVTALTAGGFELCVDASASRYRLEGDARLVARGDLLPGAFALPAPPIWS